jgi:hypothetical protein
MIIEESVKGVREFAKKLNAGEFDHLPHFTTGQLNENGVVVPLSEYGKKTFVELLEEGDAR